MKKHHCVALFIALLPLAAFPTEAEEVKSKGKEIPGARYTMDEMVNAKTTDEVLKVYTNHDTPPQWKVDLVARAHDFFQKDEQARFEGLIEDSAFMKIVKDNNMELLGGPLLGQITETSASVWVRTIGPANVVVKVGDKKFGPVRTSAKGDFSTTIKITGLKPDQEYPYTVIVDGKSTQAGGLIKTINSSNLRIAFGSCSHRWGLGRQQIWDQIIKRGNKALLAYGDIAVQDRMHHFGLHRFDYFMRDQQAPWSNLQANVPVYATWDDHDYMENDGPRLAKKEKDGTISKVKGKIDQLKAGRDSIREVFKTSWNNPSYGFGDEGGGVFQRTRIGPVDVIMTDARYFRGIEGSFLGDVQMKWLEEQLLDCKGPFIILTAGCMWSDAKGNGKDSWGLYDKDGREKIFQLIEKHKIPGVLLTSGDWHGARVYKIDRPSGHAFYEFEPASLGGRPGPGDADKILDCIYATGGKYAFGEFTFDTELEDPTVTFRMMHEDGTALFTKTLTRSELTPN